MPQSIKTTLTGNEQVQIVIDPDTGSNATTNISSIGGSTSQLELISEGGNTGWRILGRDPANYGDIGDGAVDFSYSDGASATRGATGLNSFASGYNVESSAFGTTAMGYLAIASGNYATAIGNTATASNDNALAIGDRVTASGNTSFSLGSQNTASGDFSFTLGALHTASSTFSLAGNVGNTVNSWGATVIGTYATIAAGQTATSYVATDELFKIGNGTGTGARSDALVILKDGTTAINSTASTATLALEKETAGTNDIEVVSQLSRRTSGTAANGLGLSQDIFIENNNGDSEIYAKHIYEANLVIDGAEQCNYILEMGDGSGFLVEFLRIQGNGRVTLPQTATADIITAGAKAIITKEYGDANYIQTDTNVVNTNLTATVPRTHTLGGNTITWSQSGASIGKRILHSGTAQALSVEHSGTAGSALSITVSNASNNSTGLNITHSGGSNTEVILAQHNAGGVAGHFRSSNTATNTILEALRVSRQVSGGSGAVGLGALIRYELESDTGGFRRAAELSASWTDATNGAEYAKYTIGVAENGTVNDVLTLQSTGAQLNTYGVGTHTGTEAYALTVDASGNIIESAYIGTDTSLSNTNQVLTTARTIDLSGNTLDIISNPASTNTVEEMLTIQRTTSGTAAAGIGSYLDFHIENGSGNTAERARLEFELTDVTDTAEYAKFTVALDKAGALTDILTVEPTQAELTTDNFRVKANAEGGTASLNLQVAREVHTLAAANTSDTSINIPSGAMLMGVQFNVDTAITTSSATNTWKADYTGGSTTALVPASTSGALNTKDDTLIVPEIASASTNVRFTAPGAETFTAGVVEIVAYYFDLTSMANA